MKLKLIPLFLLLLGSTAFAEGDLDLAEVKPTPLALQVGEELEYSLRWSMFKVASGYLRVHPNVVIDGIDCHHVSLRVVSNSFADVFYKVRSEFHSYISVEHQRVVRYRVEQHEGDTHRDATIRFDWENKTANYQRDGEDPQDDVEIGTYTWDPLSVVYYFRHFINGPFEMVTLPATDGKKYLGIDIKYLGQENLEVQLGEFDSYKIEPNTKEMKGVFEKSKNSKIKMWYSNDEYRYPLLIKSKVIVGSFIAELKKVRVIQ